MPDFAGFGLAAKIAMDAVPDEGGGNAWGKPSGFGKGVQDGARQDGDPSMHEFQGSFLDGDRCKYPGCGQPRDAHTDE